ncbi:glucosaminidase domain-containing protein [Bacillus timonensis]|nr:glucosaminidase domain-containing protein [Bacillus timonensis]
MKLFSIQKHQRLNLLYITGFIVTLLLSISVNSYHVAGQSNDQVLIASTSNKQVVKKEISPKTATPSSIIEKPVEDIILTETKLEEQLHGEFQGLSATFIQAAKEQEIDPAFLVAIAAQETGWGKSKISKAPWNNIGGMICMPDIYHEVFGADYPNPGCEEIVEGGTSWQKFTSVEDSIRFKAAYLKIQYVDQGRITIKDIHEKYAPVDAHNDANGLNNHWVKNVVSIMNTVREVNTTEQNS